MGGACSKKSFLRVRKQDSHGSPFSRNAKIIGDFFDGFDPAKVAAYDEADVERLMGDAGIIRNGAKIRSAIKNAKAFVEHFW